MRLAIILFLFCSTLSTDALAQLVPIGSWQSYYPYKSATALAVAGPVVYSAQYGILEYNTLTAEYNTYSKVNGLSDVNITHLAWEPISESLLVSYQNSNIDLLQNKRGFNIPDLKNANIIASKEINALAVIDNNFYLATGLGILIIDPVKQEVREQYDMIYNGEQSIVYDVQQDGENIIALTSKGVFKNKLNAPEIKNIATWTLLNTDVYRKLLIQNGKYFLAKEKELFLWDGASSISSIYTATLSIQDMAIAGSLLNISTFNSFGYVVRFQLDGTLVDSISGQSATDLDVDALGNLWLANNFTGLDRISNGNNLNNYSVDGPFNLAPFNLKIINNDLYATAGGIDGLSSYNGIDKRGGFSRLSNNTWTNYNQFTGITAMDTIKGIMDVAVDPKTKSIYATSFGGGLMELKTDNSVTVYKDDGIINSGTGSGALCGYINYDADGNLWQTISNTAKNLVVKKKDGTWQSFEIPTSGSYKVQADFVIDNSNQLWIILPRSRGVLVFNHNNTIDNKSDDKYMVYSAIKGNGNLISNQVLSIAKDQEGKIWIGTDDGISIVNCPESAFSNGGCDADNKIVQFDVAANTLFKYESVNTIAVDGANRKWVGTSNGVWLLSESADSILSRFDAGNSPIPQNEIQKIVVDPKTGLVYISSTGGLVSYRGTATGESTNTNNEPIVFPNPITADYTGLIAIKGLLENADVRIMDASGKLVHRTKALGGQAIWNGKTYTGIRPNSGVYYVLVTNADGTKTQQTKMVFMQ